MRRLGDLMKLTEILIKAKVPIKPTRLRSDTRLKHTPYHDLVKKLLKLEFLELVPVTRNRVKYHTTDKGNHFIERVLEIYSMIEDDYMSSLIKKVRIN